MKSVKPSYIQVVICPITMKSMDYSELLQYSDSIYKKLKALGVRVELDGRQVNITVLTSFV
jgi:threonyl-tRNA synthetase